MWPPGRASRTLENTLYSPSLARIPPHLTPSFQPGFDRSTSRLQFHPLIDWRGWSSVVGTGPPCSRELAEDAMVKAAQRALHTDVVGHSTVDVAA